MDFYLGSRVETQVISLVFQGTNTFICWAISLLTCAFKKHNNTKSYHIIQNISHSCACKVCLCVFVTELWTLYHHNTKATLHRFMKILSSQCPKVRRGRYSVVSYAWTWHGCCHFLLSSSPRLVCRNLRDISLFITGKIFEMNHTNLYFCLPTHEITSQYAKTRYWRLWHCWWVSGTV